MQRYEKKIVNLAQWTDNPLPPDSITNIKKALTDIASTKVPILKLN
ncbi:hypothetical protein HMPREF3226_00343 [Prevotella corporis]|uniref:Uncharacterized protein n=1 Tax=Prevotella corporis TaxID=28128 RepID=A0A133QLX1_9BACT|nr:hypothetical protein HMPREF3226_00343 [Prevotella corporis]